jgi:nicotinamidase-related amidase
MFSRSQNSSIDDHTAPDLAACALITIDTQQDVLDGAPFEIAGTSAVLPRMAELCRAFRAAGRPIVHIVRLYRPDGANADLCRRGMLERGAELLRPGSSGAELAPELLPRPDVKLDSASLLAGDRQSLGEREVVIYKPRWGAFFQTALENHLREQEVGTLVFCGCNFPNCPRTSLYEASERDFRIVLARDAVSGLYERGERELEGIGVHLMSSAEVVGALRAIVQPARTSTKG